MFPFPSGKVYAEEFMGAVYVLFWFGSDFHAWLIGGPHFTSHHVSVNNINGESQVVIYLNLLSK